MEQALSPPAAGRLTVAEYFALAESGVIAPDERVELLDGVVVGMAPQSIRHASAVTRVQKVLERLVGDVAVVRTQLTFPLSTLSAPEPDVAVVSGRVEDYDCKHPTTALIVVEVAHTSLAQDRLTKARLYAAAGLPEYWIVNLRDDVVEVFREPDTRTARYATSSRAGRGMHIEPVAFPGIRVPVDDLLPTPDSP